MLRKRELIHQEIGRVLGNRKLAWEITRLCRVKQQHEKLTVTSCSGAGQHAKLLYATYVTVLVFNLVRQDSHSSFTSVQSIACALYNAWRNLSTIKCLRGWNYQELSSRNNRLVVSDTMLSQTLITIPKNILLQRAESTLTTCK